jgi:hypothetical protein
MGVSGTTLIGLQSIVISLLSLNLFAYHKICFNGSSEYVFLQGLLNSIMYTGAYLSFQSLNINISGSVFFQSSAIIALSEVI